MHAIDCDLYSTPSPLVGAEFETTAYYSREYGSVCRLCPDKTITVRQAEEREKKGAPLSQATRQTAARQARLIGSINCPHAYAYGRCNPLAGRGTSRCRICDGGALLGGRHWQTGRLRPEDHCSAKQERGRPYRNRPQLKPQHV